VKLQLPRILREDSTRSPHLREKYRAAYDPYDTTASKTSVLKSNKPKLKIYNLGENSWRKRCEHYDKLCEQYPLLKMSLFTIAGLVTAQGLFFKPAVNRQDETYRLAEEAVYRVDKFQREQKVISKFYETVFKAAKYGGCFWEVSFDPVFSFRIPPLQECIEPYQADEQGNITMWRQVVNGRETAQWPSNELILYPFLGETTATWPFAPSLLTGTETESEMLVAMEEATKDYTEKQAWPYEILSLGDAQNPISESDYSTARNEWRNRQPGEGIATFNVPVDIKPGGTGSAPIRELAVLCELMKQNINDAVMVPAVSQLHNATEASAKVLTQHVMTTLGQPLQWRLKEYFQEGILKPWLETSGFSRKSCPQILFESPDVHKKEEGEYWVSLVNAKIQTPRQACERLELEYDEAYWTQAEKQMQMQFEQQAKQKEQEDEQEDGEQEPKSFGNGKVERVKGKSYQVTELFEVQKKKC
jgi:hypothetical protein